jgi:alkanesulfonate monooxygenase SsuD/methylene tetrahydromethanopterin reductase-like flavin-dependent oxidoreductase (luciferase family)
MDLRIFTEPQQGASYDELLAVARAAESGGFSGFFRSDHYHFAMSRANRLSYFASGTNAASS